MKFLRSLVVRLALRNLRSDWFGTLAAVLGVALGTATVSVVYTLDVNTRAQESQQWHTNPTMDAVPKTVGLEGIKKNRAPAAELDAKKETHEDYQIMRSAIRLGSLSAFLVGALIVFFTFRVIVEQRQREIALLRSIGATPRQVAKIFLLEATLVGVIGAFLGILATPPISMAAAYAGITTTGRSQLYWLFFPWKMIFLVAGVGAGTAILGVLGPLREVLKLDVAKSLRPQSMDEDSGGVQRKPKGLVVITGPIMLLVYILIRPFFSEVLPSLAFFVFEAGLVCAGFLSLLVLVPEVLGMLGGLVGRIAVAGPKAARLLTVRRIQRSGQEFSWAVSGIMLVFALLLSLHIVTRALKDEVIRWTSRVAIANTYVVAHRTRHAIPKASLDSIPDDILKVVHSGRTPWPNALLASQSEPLKRLAKQTGEDIYEQVKDLGPGKVVLSQLMARRYGLVRGDYLKVTGKTRSAELEVVGISDIGYCPMVGPYRNSKTFATIDEADFDLLQGFADPMGAGVTINITHWNRVEPSGFYLRDLYVEPGRSFQQWRVKETSSDFRIFDVILLLTGLLAGIGIANNLVLAAHVRRREIALLRVLGMTAGQIRTLFLIEGAFIGAVGGIMAVVVGIPIGYLSLGALELISAFEVHFHLPYHYPLFTLAGAMAISLGSALYPAYVASTASSSASVHYE